MCVELSGRLSEHGFSPFSTNRQSILKGQISAVTLPDNAIRRLIGNLTIVECILPIPFPWMKFCAKYSLGLYLLSILWSSFTCVVMPMTWSAFDDSVPSLLLYCVTLTLWAWTFFPYSGSRIQTYLLAFLESSHRSAPTLPGGLAPVSKELEEIAMKFGRLVHFNKLVYSPFYQKILQEIVQEGESNDT